MLNKIKHFINAVKVSINERREQKQYIAELRSKEDQTHNRTIKEAEVMQRRPARTIANAPRIEIKKAA